MYVDGTEQGADIDESDTVDMAEMAGRGYVAVTVDYGEKGIYILLHDVQRGEQVNNLV